MALSKAKMIKLLTKRIELIDHEEMRSAIREHAWLLAAEGLSHKEISTRLGCTEEQARRMVKQFGREVSHAMGSYQTAATLRMV